MAPFRWLEMKHELALAKELAKYFPEQPHEWDEVAKTLSKALSTNNKQVEVKERGCREKMDRILEKFKSDVLKIIPQKWRIKKLFLFCR